MEEKFLNKFMYDKNRYQLVIEYFTYILNNNFLLALSYFAEGISYTYEYLGVNFSKDLNGENVVVFYNFDYEIYVNPKGFIRILKLACIIYIEEEPNYRNEIITLFNIIYKNLL